MRKRHREYGYTLIELLLVVTVIALIAALAVKSYRDKSQSDRVSIAALSMQHVLESAMAYNVANAGAWPQSNKTLPCSATPTDTDFVQKYLPNQNNQNNFGGAFCWSGDDPAKGTPTAPRFWVAMGVSGETATEAENTAKRIAARLPNAIVTNDPAETSTTAPANTCNGSNPCYVKAEVAIPSATSNNKASSYLAAVGVCDPSKHQDGEPGSSPDSLCKKTKLMDQFPTVAGSAYANDDALSQYEIDFTCKPNEIGKVYVTPNFLQVDRDAKESSGALDQLIGAGMNCDAPSHDGKQKCIVTLTATSGGEANTKPTILGCTDNYVGLGICSCEIREGVSQTHCGSKPGYVGATYIAICLSISSETLASRSDILY